MSLFFPEQTGDTGADPIRAGTKLIRAGSGDAWRVAIISHSGSLYGAGRSLLELVYSLVQMGLEVGVVLPYEGPLGMALRHHSCTVWYMPVPSWLHMPAVESDILPDWREFEAKSRHVSQCLNEWGADLVWTNSTVTPVGASAAQALGVPHFWHLRELNGAGFPHRFCVEKRTAVELINAADCRIAVSRSVKDFYENLGCNHCEWIYNGIGPAERLAERRRTRKYGGPARLLFVGRVDGVKGTETAIEAVKILRDLGHAAVLRVVGDGDIAACRRLAATLGIADRIEYTGFSQHVDDHYRWADIALSCASIEAMGRVTAEAMSWGLPVAGHHAAGTGELLRHSGGGLRYDGSTAHLAEILSKLIEDPAAARQMGTAGQRWVRGHASSERHASRIREVVAEFWRDISPPNRATT